jgi:hypothetical protein
MSEISVATEETYEMPRLVYLYVPSEVRNEHHSKGLSRALLLLLCRHIVAFFRQQLLQCDF